MLPSLPSSRPAGASGGGDGERGSDTAFFIVAEGAEAVKEVKKMNEGKKKKRKREIKE